MSKTAKIATRQILLAAGDPFYFMMRIARDDVQGVQVAWHDATSAFTIDVYTSLYQEDPDPPKPTDTDATPDLEYWHDETGSVAMTGGVGAAAGSDILYLGNCAAEWLLLRLTVSVDSLVSILKKSKE